MNQNLLTIFDRTDIKLLLPRCNFPKAGTNVICGVSGGPDSTALMLLALAAGLEVKAVHVDHGLRLGSNLEAEFVKKTARTYGAEFEGVKVELKDGSNLEERSRVARREVLGEQALTGHTADDQAETLIINLLRGSGVYGLAGIKADIRHPILALRRQETHKLCSDLDLQVISDPSNQDSRFVRNRIRNELLPLINKISKKDVTPVLARTAAHNRQLVKLLEEQSHGVDPTNTRTLISYPKAVQNHILREWLRDSLGHPPSAAELERVMQVVLHRNKACEISGGRRIARTDGVLRVETTSDEDQDNQGTM